MKRKLIAITTLSLLLFMSVGTGTSPMLHRERGKPPGEPVLGESDGDLRFQWNTNASCFAVSVFSLNSIYIDDLIYNVTREINGTQETAGASVRGFFLTNGTWFGFVGFGTGDVYRSGNTRYVHFDWGPFNYTYEDRPSYNISGRFLMGEAHLRNRTLPPGQWYFVFTSALFDLEHDVVLNKSIQINFSDRCTDLHVSTAAGGTVYALWYGEFDANLIVSKADIFEAMANGKYTFHVDNTFMYTFWDGPNSQGLWRIKWVKPDGSINTLNSVILYGNRYPDKDETCIQGMGPNGTYELVTSYVDYAPLLSATLDPSPLYFLGVDVKLP